MSERSVAPRALCAVAVVALAGGCGPIMSTSLIIDAEAKMAALKAAEAEKYAPYEFTAATQYLRDLDRAGDVIDVFNHHHDHDDDHRSGAHRARP